jgi:ATP-binding cassette, subfamily B, multidrug efflux pump
MSARPRDRMPALLRMMWPRLRAYRWQALAVLLLLPLSSVMAMLLPYLTKVAVDEFIVPAAQAHDLGPYREPLYHLIALAAGVVLVGYLADAVYVALLQRAGQRIIAEMRELVYRRSLRLPRSYFDRHPIGAILTRVTSDIEALGEGIATGVLSLFVDGLKTVAYLSMMFYLNWRLTLVLLVLLPVLALLVRYFQRRVRETFFVARQALSEATGYLQECLAGVKTIQLFGAERQALERFKGKNYRFYKAQNRSNFYDALLFALVEGVTTLALALVLWYAAGSLLAGALTLGVLVAFMEYIQRLFVPVREFSQQLAVIQRSMAALDHINELCRVPLDEAEAPPPDEAPAQALPAPAAAHPAPESLESLQSPQAGQPEPFRELVFEDVRFRYRDDQPEILKGISFTVRKGQTLALVGATGSGKSTVIRLLTRAYGGYGGSIRINGEELRDIPAARLGRLISVVHQGVFLFHGSVGFNIALERPGISREAVEQAARYVHAHDFIHRLDGGYDAPITQGGVNLSAGQAQLLSFARAVAAQTELIVLDEATSSVDSMTEHLIQMAVGRLYQDKTVIAIAHRLSTIRSANTILVLSAGQVLEAGSHAELMARGGAYAALVGRLEAGETPGEAVDALVQAAAGQAAAGQADRADEPRRAKGGD